jgi:hypothetical protein
MWMDWEKAQEFRLETIEYVKWNLGLAPDEPTPRTRNSIILSFDTIGSTLRDGYSDGKANDMQAHV